MSGLHLQKIENGKTVMIEGYEFAISNMQQIDDRILFTGTCTDSPRNDSIRNTSYNGGTYGGNKLKYRWDSCIASQSDGK